HGVDLEQHVAFIDALAFLHYDLVDLAGDVGRDQKLLRADIGTVGADIAAAIEIEDQSADHGCGGQPDEQQEAPVATHAGHQPAARLGGSLGGRGLLPRREFEDWVSHSAAPSAAFPLRYSEW